MSSKYTRLPNEQPPSAQDEMEAAFDESDDDDEHDHSPSSSLLHRKTDSLSYSPLQSQPGHPLETSTTNANNHHVRFASISQHTPPTPGTYDFEYDYPPPPGSPPRPSALALPNSYGNSNGQLPTSPVARTTAPSLLRRAFGAILPTHYARDPRGGGMQNDGVFANVVAKPAVSSGAPGADISDSPYFAPEEAQKEAPPSYAAAQADAVPGYWDNTIFAPSPHTPGELIIDSLPTGSLFSFLWNLLVSMSFQFVGFILTYLLHTTHAAKHGSRAGLGITLIQFGFYMRTKDAEMMDGEDNSIWNWPPNPTPAAAAGGSPTEDGRRKLSFPPMPTLPLNATSFSSSGGMGMGTAEPIPQPQELSYASEWLSFVLMTAGWFVLLTSLLSYWRVKRYERKILHSQQAQSQSVPTTSSVPGAMGGGGGEDGADLAREAHIRAMLERAFGIVRDRAESVRSGLGLQGAMWVEGGGHAVGVASEEGEGEGGTLLRGRDPGEVV